MSGPPVVLDTDFLSAFLKIDQLSLVVNIPAFLLACKLSGFLEQDQVTTVVRALQEKDRYGFRAEVLTRLLSP